MSSRPFRTSPVSTQVRRASARVAALAAVVPAAGAIVLTVGAIALTAGVGLARAAEFAAPTLVSATDLPAQTTSTPVLSADGDYAVYIATFDGVSGIWESDLADGAAPTLVAGGDASGPSVSANGRYVAFTTTAALDPMNDSGSGCPDVYVRDMDVAAANPGAYTLVSALNGVNTGISYAAASGTTCVGGGSAASQGAAISADGRRVAFTVVGASNLTTGPGGATTTPGEQVALRDLDADSTTLVSQTMASEQAGQTPVPVPGGGALTLVASSAGTPLAASTAAISGDGSTVAWMGGETIAAQAPVGAGFPGAFELSQGYDDPLWRDVGAGGAAPTRRVTGGDDPLACSTCTGPLDLDFNPTDGGVGMLGVYRGTYTYQGAATAALATELTPQLSDDGQTVAFLSTQPTPAQEAAFYSLAPVQLTSNLFLANMAAGLTRTQALTQLTAWAGQDFTDTATTAPVTSFSLSGDGSHVAFVTSRIRFSLSPPALVSAPLSSPLFEVYDVDLRANTLALTSLGYDGAPAAGGVDAVALDDDGERIAYTSSSANLVYGIGGGGDLGAVDEVFYEDESNTPPVTGVSTIGPLPISVTGLAPKPGAGASTVKTPKKTAAKKTKAKKPTRKKTTAKKTKRKPTKKAKRMRTAAPATEVWR